MEKIKIKPGALLCPVPPVMVSCGRGKEKNIITIAWTGIINSKPPMTYISVRKSRHSHGIISREREFVINLTSEALTFAADYCGVKSGAEVNKFEAMNLTPQKAEFVGCPMIGEAPVNLECKVTEIIEFPSHDMFIAEIIGVHADKQLMEPGGRLAIEQAGLVAYVHGRYFGIKNKPIGRFGYSVMKAKTRKRLNRMKSSRPPRRGERV